jgi:hypothetical protein
MSRPGTSARKTQWFEALVFWNLCVGNYLPPFEANLAWVPFPVTGIY